MHDHQAQIANFGCCVTPLSQEVTSCPITLFSAPELRPRAGHSPAADVWSAGALLYWLLIGQLPCTPAGKPTALKPHAVC